jgi:alpha-L-fucosidase 2
MGRGAWLASSAGILLAVCSGLMICIGNAQTSALKATQTGVVFSKAGGPTLMADYYAGAGVGLHPIAIVITSSGASNEAAIGLLAKTGYDVFSLNDPLTSGLADPSPLQAVERAIRYIRFHSREWNGDARTVALIGVDDGGFLSALVGLANDSGVMGSEDSVDRESARVQAVVALFGVGDTGGAGVSERWRAMLDPLLQEREHEAALAQSSTVYANPNAPPFLLLNGEKDAAVPLARSVAFGEALTKVGLRCEVIRVQDGSHDWENALAKWLTKILASN